MKLRKENRTPTRKFWQCHGPSVLVFCIATGFALVSLASNQWDPMAFVRLGTRYDQGDPNGTIGYDGQFAYQMALDPLNAAPYLDVPAYRYQRVLYPLTAGLIGLGQPLVVPWVFIGLNIIALTVGTYVMGLILAQNRLSRWYALTVGIFAGQLVSLRLDVNEPFALTFALLAIYAFENKRNRLGAGLLALSMLSKETSIAFVGGYLLYFFLKRDWWTLIETGIISLGPFMVLQVIIWQAFGEIGLRSGGQGATSFSIIPFGGMLAFGFDSIQKFIVVLVILGPLVLLPCIALTVKLVRYFIQQNISPVAVILALHIIMMATLPFSTYVDLPGVLRLTSGLVVSTVVFAAIIQSRKMLNYSTLWIASVVFLRFFI
ncbi:MAG: hypothetical protein GY797_35095 [Deltaproteobacteria bacterium]|nr:hypothetical protein [Deltaproteobacteria bacterium]